MKTYPYPMPIEVEAIYSPAKDKPFNPLRDALPPQLGRSDVLTYMERQPPYSESDRELPADDKYLLLDRILEVFRPLTYYVDLYRAVDRAARNSFEHRNPLEPRFHQRIIAAAQNEKDFILPPGIGKADCTGFGIAGDSGIGKSHAIEYALDLLPQVIMHTKLPDGTAFPFRQVLRIKVDCPRNGSVRALCVAILEAYQEITGTPYVQLYDHKNVSADKLMYHIKRIACFHGTAVIVIDELQNLELAPSGGADQTLAFFSSLMHKVGLPVILVGTVAAVQLLSSRFSQARRATGFRNPVWHRLERNDPDWKILRNALWRYQYTAIETKIDEYIDEAFYQCTQGIADNVAKLYRAIQEKLIYKKKDKQIITPDFIHKTAEKLFALQKADLRLISGDKLAPVEPDRRGGKSKKRDFLLPEELARVKEAQKKNGTVADSSPAQESAEGSAEQSEVSKPDNKSTQRQKSKRPQKVKSGKKSDPVLGAAEAAKASGLPLTAVLENMGFAVTTSELIQGSK